ncbi:hypothetical protein ACFU7X_18255 [Streptomyces chartreusis]|uniref:hypothetical protein n=1 Tax=Streptomyces chartreusis TaxID=1969 RepID=UPI0036AA04AC
MTETQQAATATARADGRDIKARRVVTLGLRMTGGTVGGAAAWIGVVGVAVWIANDVTPFAPALSRVTEWAVIALVLALWGAAVLIENVANTAADWIDPDARDGDDLWEIASTIQRLAHDVRLGADYDDVRISVQCSRVLPAVEQLLGALGDMYDEDNEQDEASAAYNAALSVREAARLFGEKYGQTA